jgi:hypothetical protein
MISQLLSEIQYYEERGYYRLADKLTDSLIKYSRQFNPADIDGLQAIVSNFSRQLFTDLVSKACGNSLGFSNMNPDIFDQLVQRHTNVANSDDMIKGIEQETNNNTLRQKADAGDQCAKALVDGLKSVHQKAKEARQKTQNQALQRGAGKPRPSWAG